MKKLSLFMFVGIVMSSTFVFGADRVKLTSVGGAALAVQVANQRAQLASVESQQVINQVLDGREKEFSAMQQELAMLRQEGAAKREELEAMQRERAEEQARIRGSLRQGEDEWFFEEFKAGNENRGWSYLSPQEREMVGEKVAAMMVGAKEAARAYVAEQVANCDLEARRREKEFRRQEQNVRQQLEGYAVQLDEKARRLDGRGSNGWGVAVGIVRDFLKRVW